jgi:uncharacterized protein YhaN
VIEFYKKRTKELLDVVAPDLLDRECDSAVEELVIRFRGAKEDDGKRKFTQQRIVELKAAHAEAQSRVEAAESQLHNLRRQAQCDSDEQLMVIEDKAERKRNLEQEKSQLEASLVANTGMQLQELIAETSTIDSDRLETDILVLQERHASFETALVECAQEAGKLEQRLNELNGSDAAALALQESQELLAAIRTNIDDYVRVRLSIEILQRAMDSYRVRNQRPLLIRASTVFSKLTREGFEGLGTAYSDKDEPALVAARKNGRQIGVSGLSEGTLDQLYLALRIAAIEQFVARQEPQACRGNCQGGCGVGYRFSRTRGSRYAG